MYPDLSGNMLFKSHVKALTKWLGRQLSGFESYQCRSRSHLLDVNELGRRSEHVAPRESAEKALCVKLGRQNCLSMVVLAPTFKSS